MPDSRFTTEHSSAICRFLAFHFPGTCARTVCICVGSVMSSKDSPRTVETARTMAQAVKQKGFETQFLEVPEATHDTIVGLALPTVFFSRYGRH